MVTVRKERPAEAAARDALLDLAYGPARFTKASERLREGRRAELALVAAEGRRIVGTVRLWQVSAGPDRRVLLVGDAPYYSRFGFSSEKTSALWLPGPYERHRLLGCELKPGALDGARGLISARSALEQRPDLATLVAGLVDSDNSLAPRAA
jgi:predicted N-acetyltransferase YhbS